MATWQFDLYFIPIGVPPPDTGDEEWDSPVMVLTHVRTAQETLAYYFGQPWVMLDDWLVFGPENGNRVDVFFEDDLTASIFVRCDVRSEAPQFLAIVADLARKCECEFFCADNSQLISADLQELMLATIARREMLAQL